MRRIRVRCRVLAPMREASCAKYTPVCGVRNCRFIRSVPTSSRAMPASSARKRKPSNCGHFRWLASSTITNRLRTRVRRRASWLAAVPALTSRPSALPRSIISALVDIPG
ncbi:hypothetical protein D9M70_600280 [compost metagenome]